MLSFDSCGRKPEAESCGSIAVPFLAVTRMRATGILQVDISAKELEERQQAAKPLPMETCRDLHFADSRPRRVAEERELQLLETESMYTAKRVGQGCSEAVNERWKEPEFR